jgi:hypothetical protein
MRFAGMLAVATPAPPPLAAPTAMRMYPIGDAPLPLPCAMLSTPTRSYAALKPAMPNAAAASSPLRPVASGTAIDSAMVTSSGVVPQPMRSRNQKFRPRPGLSAGARKPPKQPKSMKSGTCDGRLPHR